MSLSRETSTPSRRTFKNLIQACYIVPGLPHVLLAPDKSKAWSSLHANFQKIREDIEKSQAEVILYFSSQWMSVLGYLFQADPRPKMVHVDPNWHELGSMPYEFEVDVDFTKDYATEVRKLGHYVREVNYRGFPIDTGTIVAQKLLNPKNRLPVVIASCNIYGSSQETSQIGEAALRCIQRQGKKVAVVVVTGLSSRFHTQDILPSEDFVPDAQDKWNRSMIEWIRAGRLAAACESDLTAMKAAEADLEFKGFHWLNGLCGFTNKFESEVFDYQPIWGTGALIAKLIPPPLEGASVLGKEFSAAIESQGAFSSGKAPAAVGCYPHARTEGEFIFLSGVGPRSPQSEALKSETIPLKPISKAKTPESLSYSIPGVHTDAEGRIIDYDIEIQTRSVISNIQNILGDLGLGLQDIVDIQVFLTNMKRDFHRFNKVYAEYFGSFQDSKGQAGGPCRTTIEIGALPTPIAVEFKVIARRRSRDV